MAKGKSKQKRNIIIAAAIAVLLIGGDIILNFSNQSQQTITINTNPASRAQIASGQEIYITHCAACHGADGQGEPNWRTPNDDGTFPAPPHNSQGHTWHHPDQQLLEIIAQGGTMPGSQMPAFADKLNQADMIAVLAYIKTFWGEEELAFQAEATKNFLSQ